MTDWQNRITGYGEESPDQLLANPRNHRIHPKRQQDALSGSLDTLGVIQTVIVNKRTQHIVDGHLRVSMALREGQKSIPVTYVDLSEAEEAQALLSLDPIAAMAATDAAKVEELLQMVQTDNAEVMKHLTDFAAENKLDWGQPEQVDAEPQIDRAEELRVKWGVETGQMWQLGEHRLICGDCTDKAVVDRVMGGEKANLMISDPPYNVGYEYNGTNDDKAKEDYADFCNRYFSLGMSVSNMQIITPGKANERLYAPSEWMTWYKGFGLSRGHYFKAMVTEPILLFGEKPKNKFYPTDHFDVPTDREKGLRDLHTCPKPVSLFEALIEPMTDVGNTVYEAFSGSGTTIIACENLGRKCRAVEISPAYVAVALERWATATGKTPVLVD